jgi:hypothetical protein
METADKILRGPRVERLKAPSKELLAARGSFRTLLAGNPNYFGNLKESAYTAILAVNSNTWY